MMDIIPSYTNATQLLQQGRAKDAYSTFLSVVELSTQQLHGVKFVHQTLVSKPLQYDDSIALLRSCLDHLEKIAIQNNNNHLPGATTTTIKLKSPPPPPPPPLPPKPIASNYLSQKPTIPPKPKQIITSPHQQSPSLSPKKSNVSSTTTTTTQRRTRGNSVSFAEDSKLSQTTIIKSVKELIREDNLKKEEKPTDIIHEETDDEEEEEVFEFKDTFNKKSNEMPVQHKLRARSKSCTVESDICLKDDLMNVLAETVVDPRRLAPAQTNTSDSLTIPTASQHNQYVPNIPMPPLLATHRRLQNQLSECEKRTDDNNENISCVRQMLEKVRTLYMSAMTIPSILQFSPSLVAYQLTLIESSIFRGIPPDALLSHSARTPHKKIVASTDFFNFMTRAIEHSILLPQEHVQRADLIQRWIKIANKLLTLHNYQTLKAVVSALGTPPVKRLRRTWECVPKKRTVRLEFLNGLMSESDNYRPYRDHIGLDRKRLWSQPVIPFLGVFIHDMTYLLAATTKTSPQEDGRIRDLLETLQLFQRAPTYPHRPSASYTTHTAPTATTKRHLFRRPMSDALHFVGSTKRSSSLMTSLLGDDLQGQEIEIEQQLIVQYLLMRPWVSEKTMDALSMLREPSKPRSVSSPTTSTTDATIISSPYSTTTPNLLSNSFMRFSNSNTHQDRPDEVEVESKRSLVGGFWPFRKTNDLSRSHSITTTPSDLSSPPSISAAQEAWSDEDDDDDEEEDSAEIDINEALQHDDMDTSHAFFTSSTLHVIGKKQAHHRSLSLPSKSIVVSDLYP
ncbi:MAG: ras guanine nucleotide exchange factor domain-containing protein [Benjaminiella poitrasii]|nr:MAG: ras guanine nucleotide exchange factor domain-containing protein [Benjaminiella poitrasii]